MKSVLKDIDFDKENPESFKFEGVKKVTYSKTSTTEAVPFYKSNFNVASIVFSLQKTGNKYGIEYDMVLVLTYLNELDLFQFDISILDRNIKLVAYRKYGFIRRDFTYNQRDFFRLTELGLEVVRYYYTCIKDQDDYIGDNRKLELDTRASLTDSIHKYFKLK